MAWPYIPNPSKRNLDQAIFFFGGGKKITCDQAINQNAAFNGRINARDELSV